VTTYLTENPAADFGLQVVETDIDRLVLTQLHKWLPTYLAQAERDRDLPNRLLARPTPQSYQNTLQDASFPEGQLPAIVATTAQSEQTKTYPGRRYGATFNVAVSAVVRGRNAPETREIAAVFGGCIRAILIQQQIELDCEVRWQGGLVLPVPDQADEDARWLAAGLNRFLVLADTVQSGDGPVEPTEGDPPYPPPDPEGDPDTPYDPLATVGLVTTEVIPRS
jgi:hypothetical protein